MIYYNLKDDNMPNIQQTAGIDSLLTKEDFKIYGLRQNDNPPILIEYSDESDVSSDLYRKCQTLKDFFSRHGIVFKSDVLEENNERDDDEAIDYKIYIGLRRDIRDNIPLTIAIMKTIIFFIDGKTEILSDSKLVGEIPKFS